MNCRPPAIAGATVQIVGINSSDAADANGMFSIAASLAATKTIAISKIGSGNSALDWASVDITLKTPAGATLSCDGADVKIGYGSQLISVPSAGVESGSHALCTGIAGAGDFSLAAAHQYEITIDFDKNGTADAMGSVRMVGVSATTYPADSATVPNHFAATWNDNGSTNPGYSANHWLTISGDNATRFFLTMSPTKVVSDGSVDSSFYGYYLSNAPLPAGQYTMSVGRSTPESLFSLGLISCP